MYVLSVEQLPVLVATTLLHVNCICNYYTYYYQYYVTCAVYCTCNYYSMLPALVNTLLPVFVTTLLLVPVTTLLPVLLVSYFYAFCTCCYSATFTFCYSVTCTCLSLLPVLVTTLLPVLTDTLLSTNCTLHIRIIYFYFLEFHFRQWLFSTSLKEVSPDFQPLFFSMIRTHLGL